MDLNGPLFKKLNSKFETLEADPLMVQSFVTWGSMHNKNYETSEEFKFRLGIYLKNVEQME